MGVREYQIEITQADKQRPLTESEYMSLDGDGRVRCPQQRQERDEKHTRSRPPVSHLRVMALGSRQLLDLIMEAGTERSELMKLGMQQQGSNLNSPPQCTSPATSHTLH